MLTEGSKLYRFSLADGSAEPVLDYEFTLKEQSAVLKAHFGEDKSLDEQERTVSLFR